MRFCVLIALAACSDGSPSLRVDAKTDIVAGVEGMAIEVEVVEDAQPPQRTPMLAGDSWIEPRRVAQFDLPRAGLHRVRARIIGEAGATLMTREVVVEVRGATGITIVFDRDCIGVSCEEGLSCIASQCVDPRCTDGTQPECIAECIAATECPAAVSCAQRRCDDGVCLAVDRGVCSPGEYCNPDIGCVATTPSDAGVDAGLDAAVDSPVDGGVTMLTGVQEVSAGRAHACVLMLDGTVRCWGANWSGQLGDGTTTRSLVPLEVAGVTGATTLGSGNRHTCAVLPDRMRCWGDNRDGQLGDGTTVDRGMPVDVSLPLVRAVTGTGVSPVFVPDRETNENTTCAITNFDLRCWGSNSSGQLGNGTFNPPMLTLPAAPAILSDVTAVSGGGFHICAVHGGGMASCWGWNTDDQLGTGGSGIFNAPQAVPLGGVADIAAGEIHTCAVLVDGTAQCWGQNSQGQVGDGTSGGTRAAPMPVVMLSNVAEITAGYYHSCARLLDGTVRCWGANLDGQIGIGDVFEIFPMPMEVPGLTGVVAIEAGFDFTCAVRDDTSVWCWGSNSVGQLGDGTTTTRWVPTPVAP